MTMKELIIQMPYGPGERFSPRAINDFLADKGYITSQAAVLNALSALVSDGKLERLSHGIYSKPVYGKQVFFCQPNEQILELSSKLNKKFPFVDICIWDIKELIPLMHNIPSVRMTLVEAPRDVISSVRARISEETDQLVMENPSDDELLKYAQGRDIIVVKHLVSQAPLNISSGVVTPKIEKILVDILCDKPFYYLRGSETDHVYVNAFEGFTVNRKTLMRYASRRKKTNIVQQIITRNNL